MELVREDGNVIELKEGEKHELGRCSWSDIDRDKSVSRLHVIVELLRPASRKGKEVVGKSSGLQLNVRVVGRNPICITTSQGLGGSTSRIQFAVKGETDWLAPGDKFTLSVRRPSFFVLRQCSRGRLGGDEMVESRSAGKTTQPLENHSNSPAHKNVIEVESIFLEEEGIARAVARRQRRRLEREVEQQRMRLSEQRQSQNGGVEDPDRVKPDAESHENESIIPHQTNVLYPVNPVSGFGFIVKGSEFQAYDMRSSSEDGLAWNWKIDKKGASGEDSCHSKASVGKSKINIRNSVKTSREEDEEWGGDSEEERLSKTSEPKIKSEGSTRSSKLDSQTLDTQLQNRSRRRSKDGGGLTDFSIKHHGPKEDREDGNERINDDVETVSHQTKRRPSNMENQKTPCKYGSKCYRYGIDAL